VVAESLYTGASSETSRASSERTIAATLARGRSRAWASKASACSPSPTRLAMRTRSRRILKNILERRAPEPPTMLQERMTWFKMYARIQYEA